MKNFTINVANIFEMFSLIFKFQMGFSISGLDNRSGFKVIHSQFISGLYFLVFSVIPTVCKIHL